MTFFFIIIIIHRSFTTQKTNTRIFRLQKKIFIEASEHGTHDYYTVHTHMYLYYVSPCKSNSAERKNHLPRSAWRRRRTAPSEIINYIISGHVKNRTDPRTRETCYARLRVQTVHTYRYTFSVWYNNMRLFWS